MNYVFATDSSTIIEQLVHTITQHLEKNESVLWLVSGGSNIAVAVAVANALQRSDTSNLTVSLVDERYGDVGHTNENWQQLLDASFHLEGATLYRPLTGDDRHQTAQNFNDWLGEQFGHADYTIGLLGIGADGHTSGIKAGSEAITADGWVMDYSWDDYERITTTFDALRRLDEVVVYAMGSDKAPVIRDLLHHDVDLTMQPAQVLKQVKKSTLYTDYKEV